MINSTKLRVKKCQDMSPFGKSPVILEKAPRVQAEKDFVKKVNGLSSQEIHQLRKVLHGQHKGLGTLNAFLALMADSALELVDSSKTKTLDRFKTYIINPGKVIQRVKKIPLFIRTGKLNSQTMSYAKANLSPYVSPPLKEIHSIVQESLKLYEVITKTSLTADLLMKENEEVSVSSGYSIQSSRNLNISYASSARSLDHEKRTQNVYNRNKPKLLTKVFLDKNRTMNSQTKIQAGSRKTLPKSTSNSCFKKHNYLSRKSSLLNSSFKSSNSSLFSPHNKTFARTQKTNSKRTLKDENGELYSLFKSLMENPSFQKHMYNVRESLM